MNRADVQMLNGQLDELGNAFARNRAMSEQKQQHAQELKLRQQQADADRARVDVDQKFRDAQLKHYDVMEGKEENRNTLLQQESAAKSKQDFLKSIMALNATGQLTEESLTQVNEWLSTDPHLGLTGMQLRTPPNASSNPKARETALTQAVRSIKQYRDLAAAAEDETEAANYNHLADLIENNLPQSLKTTLPPDKQMTTVKPVFDMSGVPTGSTTNLTKITFSPNAALPAKTAPAVKPSAKKMTPVIAAEYLAKAKGNRAQAEQAAKDDGYSW